MSPQALHKIQYQKDFTCFIQWGLRSAPQYSRMTKIDYAWLTEIQRLIVS